MNDFECNYLNETVIIGLTFVNSRNEVVNTDQLFGKIVAFSKKGIEVLKTDGSTYNLPPDFEALKLAPEGAYKMKRSGEVVLNPKYMTTWKIKIKK